MIDTREIATAKIVMLGGNGGGGGTSNYNQLTNKPSINGVTLQGNKTSADLNISGMPENPLATSHGGTGNTVGYIQTGRAVSTTIGLRATAEGGENESSGEASHAEGSYNVASGNNSHAEGYGTTASDLFAHAEGYNTTASEDATHAEGRGTTASEWYAHAEGHDTTASGEASHAEGASTTASNTGAHSEGVSTTASGSYSHAGGANSVASGSWSFAHGVKVTAGYDAQTAIGNRNNNKSNTLFEVGNGRYDTNTGTNIYSNAFEVYSNGNIVAGGTVSDANGTLNAVVGNPSDTASSIIDKIKIGSRTYDTLAIKPYTATNITTSAITISIGLAEASALNGRIIAVNTGSRSGTPSNAWGVNILYNGGGSSVGCAILKSDGTVFTDAVTANEVLFLSMDMTNLEATIVNIAGASGGGGGSSDPYDGRKTRYTISSSNWSSSPNSDGYYTYSLTLTNPLTTSTSPNVYIAGASDSTQPTATESTMFSYVKRCNLSSSTTLVLYADTKPTSTFYVFVGAEGGASGEVYSTTETAIGTWEGSTLYRRLYHLGNMPNDTNTTILVDLPSNANIKNVSFIAKNATNGSIRKLPYYAGDMSFYLYATLNQIDHSVYIYAKDNWSTSTCDMIVEYTKS